MAAKESEAAGQLKDSRDTSKASRESCNTESSSNEEQKVLFALASDTDSVESLDMQSKCEQDTDTQAHEDSNKELDTSDSGLFAYQRTKRLSSSDSYLSHQDSMKTMPWYASSLDFDVGPDVKGTDLESPQLQLDKISESHLETKLEELHLGHAGHRTMNRTSTPAHEVRFNPGEDEISVVPLKPVKEEFDNDMGGRSSPESSGRGLYLESII